MKDISLANICDRVFDILENQFEKDVTRFLISLIIASRDGILESEITDLLEQSKLAESMSFRMNLRDEIMRDPILFQYIR